MKINTNVGAVVALLLLSISNAYAALPAAVATAFTTASDDFGDLMDLAWPFIITVVVAFLAVKFFKRVIRKA